MPKWFTATRISYLDSAQRYLCILASSPRSQHGPLLKQSPFPVGIIGIKGNLFLGTAFLWHGWFLSHISKEEEGWAHFTSCHITKFRKKTHVASSMAGSLHTNCLGLLRDTKTSDLFFSLWSDLKNWPAKVPFWKQQQVIQVADSKQFSTTLQEWGFTWPAYPPNSGGAETMGKYQTESTLETAQSQKSDLKLCWKESRSSGCQTFVPGPWQKS